MLPEIGHFALIIALCLALVQGIFPLLGAARCHTPWIALARPAARGQSLFLLLAFTILVHTFISNDFSVAYVAQHSNTNLPLYYRISAVWGGHEGSLLLWSLLLGFWTLAVSMFSRSLPDIFLARVLAVMGLISVGFLLFMLLTSNPFARLTPAALDGNDLNPLLQDIGLVVHPPMLYMGYVGFSVAFGFAIAALLGGRLDAAWARWSRPWATIAWVFLTLGIALGSWWAYYELGWGGWWFWDPVENASFMPWLVGTALLHSLAATEKRGVFKSWTVLLAICVFSLSLLGTFLVRSGVLTSVHAFANDPTRGVFILLYLGAVVGSSLILYAWRMPCASSNVSFAPVSRESFMLANNVLLLVAAASILLGTLYPLAIEALGLGKLSVGPPYFNTVFMPLLSLIAITLVLGMLTRWKQDSLSSLQPHLQAALLAAGLLAVLLFGLSPSGQGLRLALGVALTAWIVCGVLLAIRTQIGHRKWRFWAASRSFYGMCIAHLGLACCLLGITVSSLYSSEALERMTPGQKIQLSGYTFRFEGITQVRGSNYAASEGDFTVFKDGQEIARLRPQKRIYQIQQMPMTEAAIAAGLLRDLYVSLGESLDNSGAWSVRLYYKPMVRWIWLGALLMACGGILACSDRRYRLSQRARVSMPVSAALVGEKT